MSVGRAPPTFGSSRRFAKVFAVSEFDIPFGGICCSLALVFFIVVIASIVIIVIIVTIVPIVFIL